MTQLISASCSNNTGTHTHSCHPVHKRDPNMSKHADGSLEMSKHSAGWLLPQNESPWQLSLDKSNQRRSYWRFSNFCIRIFTSIYNTKASAAILSVAWCCAGFWSRRHWDGFITRFINYGARRQRLLERERDVCASVHDLLCHATPSKGAC